MLIGNKRLWGVLTLYHTFPKSAFSARLAQSVERKALNLVVMGSSPTVGVALSFREGREGTVLWCVSPKRSQAVSVTSQC